MTHNISEPAWQFQHSVDSNAPRQFAWSYWTNIANWNDPPASFHLDGPFNIGSRLTTSLPGQTLHSVIRGLKADREATIEMQLTDAILSFHWAFENLSEDRTRIRSGWYYQAQTPNRLSLRRTYWNRAHRQE